MLSSICVSVSLGIPSNSGVSCVKHKSGAVAQSRESSRTENDPPRGISPKSKL